MRRRTKKLSREARLVLHAVTRHALGQWHYGNPCEPTYTRYVAHVLAQGGAGHVAAVDVIRPLFFDTDPAVETPEGMERFRSVDVLNAALRTLAPGSVVEIRVNIRDVPMSIYRRPLTRYRIGFECKDDFQCVIDDDDPLWIVVRRSLAN
jgi:hypothetical protein